ncbi:MAG: ribonuclease P [Methanomicrobiales archaeon]|nr:ribonuclease P [Methanomicrobiales archaeon]
MAQRTINAEAQKLARERIRILFQQAALRFHEDPGLSDRYVALARRIAMRHRLRIPRSLRRQFCRHCYSFLVAGTNARVRVHRGKVVVTCFQCRRQRRYPVVRHHDRPAQDQ